MRITKAHFVLSLEKLKPFEGQGKPEIALVGRSNVGKSSLINSLCNNGKLARTSQEPGKTRLVNIYSVNDDFLLADLPGYGFAKVPAAEKKRWTDMIEGYICGSKYLKHAFVLVDIRHAPTDDDKLMCEYLRHLGLPLTVIATKADKLSKTAAAEARPMLCRSLAVQPWQVIPYSSLNGFGKDKLLEKIGEILKPQGKPIGFDLPEGISFEDGPSREM